MNGIALGPLVLAADRSAVVLGVMVFIAVTAVLAHRVDQKFESWSWWVLAGGIAAARMGHVALYWNGFAEEPWRMIALWDGGFFWPAGATAILLTIPLILKTIRQRAWSLVPLAAALVVWNTVWQLTGGTQAIPLPQQPLPALTGETYALSANAGRPKVINLWATWCPPCRREMPMMAKIAASSEAVDFYFVNQGEGQSAITRYLTNEGLELEAVLLDQFGSVARHYGALGLPATLFIGADGVLKNAHLGEISREILQANMTRLSSGD
jgi:thiol-disulfide isomerase/thioredoxin